LVALGQHLGFQGEDAIRQVLRFAPEDDLLKEAVDQMSADIRLFARRETESAEKLAFISSGNAAIPAVHESDEVELDDRRNIVVKRLRWRIPPDRAFSESGQAGLRSLRERANPNNIWNWINGKRTIKEIWERVQYGGAIGYKIVADYLDLLMAEGFAVRINP
jgi:hypothetical protein